ncbi:MAG: response regulator [Kofleriaceae bacterium]
MAVAKASTGGTRRSQKTLGFSAVELTRLASPCYQECWATGGIRPLCGGTVSKIVLCVDDSATMQQVADITFRGTEFTYVGARTYDEGLEKTKSQKPVVVLADSSIPGGKSGYDLCMAIKSNDATANVPVVILIGNGAPYDNAKGVAVGADANLPKPWDTQTMLEKVNDIVSKAAAGVAKPGHGVTATVAPAPVSAPVQVTAPKPTAAQLAAAAAAANQPPRSATIMGMPTIKMPAGVAPVATSAGSAAPTKTTVMAVPPISQSGNMVAPAPSTTTPGTPSSIRAPAPIAPPVATVSSLSPSSSTGATGATGNGPAAAPVLNISNRAPMISGSPSKRSAIVERTLAKMAAKLAEAAGIEPGSPELLALLKLSAEIVERIVWEVVPDLAEQIIRENLHDLTARRS